MNPKTLLVFRFFLNITENIRFVKLLVHKKMKTKFKHVPGVSLLFFSVKIRLPFKFFC